MGINLRYSPLEWLRRTKQFDFGGASMINVTEPTIASYRMSTSNREYCTDLYVNKLATGKNDGSSWRDAYTTIAAAIARARARVNWGESPWAIGDTIHIAPGSYAETLTALPHGCTLKGYGEAWDADGETGVRIKPAAGSPVDVGGYVNAKIININFESADTSRVFDSTIINNVQFIHCRFAGAPEATTSTCGIYTSDSVMMTIRDCRFQYLDCGIDFVYADGGDSWTRGLIEGNYFTYISEAGIRIGLNLVTPGNLICGNYIGQGGQTMAIGIDINVATPIIDIYGNFITASEGIQGDDLGSYVGGNYVNGVLE